MKFLRLIFLLLIVFGAIWAGGLVWFATSVANQSNDMQDHTDAIVVLTGGSDRLREAIRLLDQNYAGRMFVSGAGEGVTIADIFNISQYPREHFDDLSRRIEIGYEAKTTKENAVEVFQWVRDKSYRTIRLVTSNYHMERSYIELKNLLPEVKIIKHAVAPEQVLVDKWWKSKGTRELIIDEYNKLIGTVLQIELSYRRGSGTS